MPRKPRSVLPGHPQYLIRRGSNRCPIFITDDDYGCSRYYLQEACSRHGCNIHAYVFITNHILLFVRLIQKTVLPRQCSQLAGNRFDI